MPLHKQLNIGQHTQSVIENSFQCQLDYVSKSSPGRWVSHDSRKGLEKRVSGVRYGRRYSSRKGQQSLAFSKQGQAKFWAGVFKNE